MEEKAARAYDLAALKYWGPSTHINFPVSLPSFLFTTLVSIFPPSFSFYLFLIWRWSTIFN